MSTEIRPAHSPLGASGAERWMNCPGSVALLRKLNLPPTDDPEYRTLGSSAHLALEDCLRSEIDAWEVQGSTYGKHECDAEMVLAIQNFIDVVRDQMEPGALMFIERGIDYQETAEEVAILDHRGQPATEFFSKYFYGTIDCGILSADKETLFVNDYKHGEGIAVDVEWNPQIMYYGYGLLRQFPSVKRIVFRIIQPRGYHPAGPVRKWECSADELRTWAETELLPAMLLTQIDNSLDAGPWCRFCPAKLICPLLVSLFGTACRANKDEVIELSDQSLGLSYQYGQAVKHYLKALDEEVYRRLNAGGECPGTKLVLKKADRVFKAGAKEAILAVEGVNPEDVFTKPELKTPAQMEKLGAAVKKVVNEYAYAPQTGLTVALTSDKRVGVKVQTMVQAFAGAVENLEAEDGRE